MIANGRPTAGNSAAHRNVMYLPRNRVGRDFVVGDVGGAFDLVFQAMRDAAFEPSRDRLLSVGHLLASASSLTSCIQFLRAPSVFAVRSNNEQDLLDLFADGPPDDESVAALASMGFYGMEWLATAGQNQRAQLVGAMRMLPLAISIGDRGACTGYVHGGLPHAGGWRDFLAGLQCQEEACVSAALRGLGCDSEIIGVDRVFVCYTPEWDLTHCHANTIAVAPGPFLQPVEAMMSALKLVESREGEHE